MAIIVEQLSTGNEYVLMGVGLGVDPGNLSARFLNNFLPNKVAVCDRNGKIFWLPASEVIVVEIEGQKPSELLPEPEKITPDPTSNPNFESSDFESSDFGTQEFETTKSETTKFEATHKSSEVTSPDEFDDDGEWL